MQEEAIQSARELLTGLLEHMGIPSEIDLSFREGELYIEMKGAYEGVLIGRHGRTLEALQLVVNRMINNRLGMPVKVVLDVNSYRKRRVDSLRQMALRLGEKVKRTGREQTVGPFNSYDRRIIHLAIKEDSALQTESQGEGEMKKIKIAPSESNSRASQLTADE